MVWSVLIVRLFRAAPRHKQAVSQQLRRGGAAQISPDVWTVPATPYFDRLIERSRSLAEKGNGDILVLSTHGSAGPSEEHLRRAFEEQLIQECRALMADCDHFDVRLVPDPQDKDSDQNQRPDAGSLRRRLTELRRRNATDLPEVERAVLRVTESLRRPG